MTPDDILKQRAYNLPFALQTLELLIVLSMDYIIQEVLIEVV